MKQLHLALGLVVLLTGCDGVSPSKGSLPPTVSEQFLRRQQECERRPSIERSKFSMHLDNGPSLRSQGGATVWRNKKMYLGDTCFIANAGPVYYIGDGDRKLAHYVLDVEHAVADSSVPDRTSYLVLFSREIAASELPPDFDRIEIGDIVSYDVSARKALFKIGRNRYEYKLPAV